MKRDRFKVGDVLVMGSASGLMNAGATVTVVRCVGDGFPTVRDDVQRVYGSINDTRAETSTT